MIKDNNDITPDMSRQFKEISKRCRWNRRNDGCFHPETPNQELNISDSSNYYLCNVRVCPRIEQNRNGANEK